MPYVLYATGAALILSIIGNMVLAAKLAMAREVADDLREERAAAHRHKFAGDQSDLRMRFNEAIAGGPNANGDAGWIIHTNGHASDLVSAIECITDLRAAEARRMAPLIKANADRKAKAANGRIGA